MMKNLLIRYYKNRVRKKILKIWKFNKLQTKKIINYKCKYKYNIYKFIHRSENVQKHK
jgi:hypothetical protein